MIEHIAGDREPLDLIIWNYYQELDQSLEMVLKANPGIAKIALALPAGTVVYLPERTLKRKTEKLMRLFD